MSGASLVKSVRWSTVKRMVAQRRADARRRRWQRAHLDPAAPKRPVFVSGLQRSGTNMLMWTLEQSLAIQVFHEHRWNAAFRAFRLRPTDVIQRLIDESTATVVAFKPVCDSHLIDRYLERHAGARALWIYRDYRDVINSAIRNFGAHQKDVMRWIANGDYDRLGWRGERLTDEMVDVARRFYHEDMQSEEAGAYLWYIRNLFFFEQGLDRDERVKLVRYETLVQGAEAPFRDVFEFVGLPFESSYLEGVFASSVGKHPFPEIAPEIATRCDELTRRLDDLRDPAASATAATGTSA